VPAKYRREKRRFFHIIEGVCTAIQMPFQALMLKKYSSRIRETRRLNFHPPIFALYRPWKTGRLPGAAPHPVGAYIKFGPMRMSDNIFPQSICSNVPRRDMCMRRMLSSAWQ
jgi:hypothetical protein